MFKPKILLALLAVMLLGAGLAQAQPSQYILANTSGYVRADSVSTQGTGSCSTGVYWFNDLVPYGAFIFRHVSRDSQATTRDSVFVPWSYYKLVYKDNAGAAKYATTDSTKSSLTTWTTIKAAAADSVKLLGRNTTNAYEYDFRTLLPDGVIFKFSGCLARDTGSTIVRVKAVLPQKTNSLLY
jgi:hypothetical protein